MLKLMALSVGYTIIGSAGLAAAHTSGTLIEPKWVIGILVTIIIAAFAALGTIVKIAYDTATKWEALLGGDDDDGGDRGFIQRSNDRHDELQQAHERVYEQLRIQGQLLSELAYSFQSIAEELEDEDEMSIEVDLDRIEDLHEEKRDSNFRNGGDD